MSGMIYPGYRTRTFLVFLRPISFPIETQTHVFVNNFTTLERMFLLFLVVPLTTKLQNLYNCKSIFPFIVEEYMFDDIYD